jgi:DNA-binding NtrC family response regulator
VSDQFMPLAGKRILIVDDSPQVTALVADVFGLCGAAVATANTGRDAMVQIQVATFDLVVLDLVMPEPDGWDVLRFMKTAKPALLRRTILLTGDRYHRQTRQFIDEAELRVVFKPFAVDDLRAAACDALFAAESSIAV